VQITARQLRFRLQELVQEGWRAGVIKLGLREGSPPMRLPSPAPAYSPQDQAQTRHLVETGMDNVTSDVQTLRDAAPSVTALVTASNLSVPAPRVGSFLILDITNSSAGVIVVTLDAVFLGTFPAPGAGKRRTQMYLYDRSITKWVPVGAQSPDL
jgi:hypothetical protein